MSIAKIGKKSFDLDNPEQREAYWNARAATNLVGRKITAARYLTRAEADEIGWSSRPVMICLDDSTQLIPQSDDEGNDGGALSVSLKSGDASLPVLS